MADTSTDKAWDQIAQDGIQEHRRAMNYLFMTYTKRTVEVDAQEIGSMLAGLNAADRTPVVKASA